MNNIPNDDYWKEFEKIIKETLICGSIVSLSKWNGSKSIKADIDLSSNLLEGTAHEVKSDVELIHYTSITSLFEIVNSKKLRLMNASQMNDPQEILYSLKKLGDSVSDESYKQSSNIFLASFCEYVSDSDNREHFSMWRNYGENGNGVGIVFKLANYDLRNRWIHSALGKVDYNNESLSLNGINRYFEILKNMKSQNKFSIENLPRIIFQIACLNKAPIWAEEKEIRLFRFLKWDKSEWNHQYQKNDFTKEIKATYINNSLKYFIEIDLDNRTRLEQSKKLGKDINDANKTMKFQETDVFDIYPALSIEKIVFGYRIPRQIRYEVCDSLRRLGVINFGNSITFEDSIYTDYFQENSNRKKMNY